MLDHVSLGVSDFDRAVAFYDAALKPLGISRLYSVTPEMSGSEAYAGYGEVVGERAHFWIGTSERSAGPIHVAFAAPTRALVDEFHRAALAAGGRDNGAPGVRPHYHPDYYGAFVLDPEGHNVEAVCRAPA